MSGEIVGKGKKCSDDNNYLQGEKTVQLSIFTINWDTPLRALYLILYGNQGKAITANHY